MIYDTERAESALRLLESADTRDGKPFDESKSMDNAEHIPMYYWPAEKENEDLMVLVHRGDGPWGMHRHDYFVFNFIYRGMIHATVNGRQRLLEEGDICILQPGSAHNLSVCPDGEDGILLSIAAKQEYMYRSFLPLVSQSPVFLDFFIKCMDNSHAQQTIELRDGCSDVIRRLLDAIMIEAAERQEAYRKMLACLFASVLIQLARGHRQETNEQEAERHLSVEPVLEYMAENYVTLTLAKTAEHFNYNPSYLSSVLNKKTGKSFNALLKEFKLERARQLLTQTDIPVSAVAAMVGYPHLGNFHKLFKAAFGVTPNEFRRQSGGKATES